MTETTAKRALVLAVLVVASGLTPFVGAAAAAPSGMVTVPDSQITADVPAGESVPISAQQLRGNVLADQHADSLEVIITTPERAQRKYMGSDANVIGDGEVALVLRDSQTHEGRDVAIDAGLLREALGRTPTMIYGTHSSGETWTSPATYVEGFLRFHVDRFSSNTVTFSGEVQITSTATDGSTISYQLNDLDAASNVTINTTGQLVTETEAETGTALVDGESTAVSLAGNLPVQGPASGEPRLKVTAYAINNTNSQYKEGGLPINYDIDAQGATRVKTVTIRSQISGGSDDGSTDVYVEGTKIASINLPAIGDNVYTLAADVAISGGVVDVKLANNPDASVSVDYAKFTGRPVDMNITADTGQSYTVTSNGTTSFAADLSTSTTSLSFTGPGEADISLNYTERTQTTDPAVQLNSNWSNVSGTLSAGETVSKTLPKSALQGGTNTINVSMPSLSSDAPTMQVGLNVSHSAASKQTVVYEAEKYSERYNISKTFASARQSATATIPFEGNVHSIRDVKTRTNGGSWTTATTWSLNETTLTVELGAVDAGDTVTVVANGSKVVPQNGEIQVTDPVTLGQSEDPRIKVTSRSSGDFALLYSGTPQRERIHYAYNETWQSPSEYAYFAGTSQKLVAPNVEAGDAFRSGTIPVLADPVADAGDVEIRVTKPAQTKPQFTVKPGTQEGDKIKFTYLNAQDSTTYQLYSETLGIVFDSGTANSPVTLTAKDTGGLLEFIVDTATGGGGDGDDGDGVLGPVPGTADGLTIPLSGLAIPILGLTGLAGIGYVALRNRRDSRRDTADSIGGRAVGVVTTGGRLALSGTVRVARWLRTHPYATGILATIAGVALVVTGSISLSNRGEAAVFAVAVPLGSYLALTAADRFNTLVWGGVSAVGVIFGLIWSGVDLFGQLLNQQVSIILAVGGMYLLYRGIQAYQAPDKVQRFVFRGGSGGDEK